MNRDYCYVCDRETEWDAQEVCSGCGRTWGKEVDDDPVVQAIAEALRVHRTDEIHAMCLCGWESPHGRALRTTHCLNHQAEAAAVAARQAITKGEGA